MFKIILFLFFFHFLNVGANELPFDSKWRKIHYTIQDGLSCNEFQTLVQDSLGYMWLGSTNGLNRFDGLSFKIYKSDLLDTNSLPDNYINQIVFDKKGQMLIATAKGLCIYDKIHDNFIRIKSTMTFAIRAVLVDQYGNYWLGTQGSGLLKYSSDFRLLNSYSVINSDYFGLKSNFIWALFEDSEKYIWIGTLEGDVYSFNPRSKKVTKVFNGNNNGFIRGFLKNDNKLIVYARTKSQVFEIVKDDKGVYTDKKLRNLPKHYIDVLKGFDNVGNCYFDKDSSLWIAHEHGFSIVNEKLNLKINSNSLDFPIGTRFGDMSNQIYKDKYGSIWIATHNNGIVFFSKKVKNFRESDVLFNDKNVLSIFEDSKGDLWIGTEAHGLFWYNKKNKSYTNYLPENASKYGFDANTVFAICETSDNQLFFGTYQGLFSLSKNSQTFRKYPIDSKDSTKLNFHDIRDFLEVSEGKLWVATNGGGINILDLRSEKFTHLQRNANYPDRGIVDNYCLKLLKEKKGNVWIGTYNGFSRYNLQTRHSLNITNEPIKVLSNNWIYSLYEDADGLLWMATTNGLNVYNSKTGKIRQYFQTDGLADNLLLSILGDEMNNVWISTGGGLSKYNRSSGKFTSFSKSLELPTMGFVNGVAFKNKKGELFFGGNGGYVSFLPDEINDNPFRPKVMLTDLKLFYKTVQVNESKNSILTQNIGFTQNLTLQYDQNVITFEYIAISYLNPDKIQYACQMVGFDDDWRFVGSKRDITYTNLNPGEYVFRIKAANDDGIWSEESTEIYIHIVPPFWKTWWFILIGVGLIISIFVGLHRYRVAYIKKRNYLLEIAVKTRTEELERQKGELKEQKEIVENVNMILREHEQELQAQSEELQAQSEELYNQTLILEETNKQIARQRDDLEQAYKELSKYQNKLEQLVEERTKDLLLAKDKAEQSDKLKTAFLANLSHEIRTPLNAIIGFSNLLLSSDVENEEKESFGPIIERNGLYLLSLINDILDVSKIESGLMRVNKSEFILMEFINEIKIIYKEEVKKLHLSNPSLEFRMNIADDIKHVKLNTDQLKLRQIVTNLINNAIKYTNGGYVEFGCSLQASMVLFYVKDTGVGINKEYHDKIFDRFYKVEESQSQLFRGTGLGLAIVKQLSDLLNGKIWVESEVNKGSTFYFTLPRS